MQRQGGSEWMKSVRSVPFLPRRCALISSQILDSPTAMILLQEADDCVKESRHQELPENPFNTLFDSDGNP